MGLPARGRVESADKAVVHLQIAMSWALSTRLVDIPYHEVEVAGTEWMSGDNSAGAIWHKVCVSGL